MSAPLWDYNLCIGNGSPAGGYPANFELPRTWYYTGVGGSGLSVLQPAVPGPGVHTEILGPLLAASPQPVQPRNTIALIDEAVNELSDNNPSAIITNGTGTWPNSTPSMDIPIGRHNARWQRLGIYDWPNMTNSNLRTRWTSPVDPATVTPRRPIRFKAYRRSPLQKSGCSAG